MHVCTRFSLNIEAFVTQHQCKVRQKVISIPQVAGIHDQNLNVITNWHEYETIHTMRIH